MPDLYEGRVFENLEEGAAHAQGIGFGTLVERGRAAAAELPAELVYAGFSLGVLPAQYLAQTRTGAKGALLFHSCVPASEFGGDWPRQVPVQIHGMEADEYFVDEGDLDAARALVESAPAPPSSSSTPASSTCSPTTACRRTTSTPPRCSPDACSPSSTASSRGPPMAPAPCVTWWRWRRRGGVCPDRPTSGAGPAHASSPPRSTSWRTITFRWISLVPSPTIISGASRK